MPSTQKHHADASSIASTGTHGHIGIIDARAFIDFIDSEHLANMVKMPSFVHSIMVNRPLIPVGSDRDFIYRLLAQPYDLTSSDSNRSLNALDASRQHLLPHCHLGLNPYKEHDPASPKTAHLNSSPSSISSTHSEDDNSPGFVFLQLGELQYACHHREDDWSPNTANEIAQAVGAEDMEGRYDWMITGYNLVARLRPENGRVDGIYALYNMFPYHPYKQDFENIELVDAKWNLFPCGHPDPAPDMKLFAAARIADKLGDLGFARVMRWEDQMERVQLVRVRETNTTALGVVRLSVFKV